ncbi:MAG: hypothetical protein P1U69_08280 [Parvibaculaceae bacterium]|nr:hypothetical protein [Parvibaculaceae bacterium]HBM87466.1 hypothetical protein [Rhodobiaceae bacterium]|tara:strand:+ start:3557 stop:4240 length:684 start_codon:yes stop_codon:yes gene_type:complete
MDRSHIAGFLILLGALLSLTAPAHSGNLYVYSATIPVHENPDSAQIALHTLSYGDQVTVADEAVSPKPSEWLNGKIEVDAACIVGYIRADALLPLPAPDLALSGFQSLTNHLQEVGPAKSERQEDVTTLTQQYDHGVTISTRTFHTPYGDFEDQSLLVSDITVAQGFLLARSIVNQDGVKSEHMNRLPKIEMDEQGNAYVLDDGYWQIISVTQTPDGVLIQFPERAD